MMKNLTKFQRILFSIGIILGCGALNLFHLKTAYPILADFTQGFGIGLMIAVLFCKKLKKAKQYF
jgi:hypothetical protein